jgi:hypothetical protein
MRWVGYDPTTLAVILTLSVVEGEGPLYFAVVRFRLSFPKGICFCFCPYPPEGAWGFSPTNKTARFTGL